MKVWTLRRDMGGPLKKMWLFFGLTLLCFTFPSPSSAQDKLETLLGEISSSTQGTCYVCSSVDGECETDEKRRLPADLIKNCKEANGEKSYLETVYGSLALKEKSTELKMWPQSLTDLAKGAAPPPPPPTGNSSSTPRNATGEYGWTYATFPGSFQERVPSAAKEKFSASGLSLAREENEAVFKKGFQSCRVMKIWTDSQKNDGKTQEIPSSKPRIVRSCSFVPKDKGGDNFYDGCRTINFKTATISVCYCSGMGSGPDNEGPCNRSSRLQVSTIAVFLAASLLYLFGNL